MPDPHHSRRLFTANQQHASIGEQRGGLPCVALLARWDGLLRANRRAPGAGGEHRTNNGQRGTGQERRRTNRIGMM